MVKKCITITLLFILLGCSQKQEIKPKELSIVDILSPVVIVKYEEFGSGTGTCIFKKEYKKGADLYFLTAYHVVNKAQHISPFNPENIPGDLIITGWDYDIFGNKIKKDKAIGKICDFWPSIDTAIVKITVDEYHGSLWSRMATVSLMPEKQYTFLNTEDKVFVTSCPFGLPSFITRGKIIQKNYKEPRWKGTQYPQIECLLLKINITSGSSGSAIRYYPTGQVIGLCCIGYKGGYICTAIPSKEIVNALSKTTLGQMLGLKGESSGEKEHSKHTGSYEKTKRGR